MKARLAVVAALVLLAAVGCGKRPPNVSVEQDVTFKGKAVLGFVDGAQTQIISFHTQGLLSTNATRAILDRIEKPGSENTVVAYAEKLMVLLRAYHAARDPETLRQIDMLIPLLESAIREAFNVEFPPGLAASVQKLIQDGVELVQAVRQALHPSAFVLVPVEVA